MQDIDSSNSTKTDELSEEYTLTLEKMSVVPDAKWEASVVKS